MPQMSPMTWSSLIFWFVLITNLMKIWFRLINTNSNYKNNTNKIFLKNNKMMW